MKKLILIAVFIVLLSSSVFAFSLFDFFKSKSVDGILESVTGRVVQGSCNTLEQYYSFSGTVISQTNTGTGESGKQACLNYCNSQAKSGSCWWYASDGGCVLASGSRVSVSLDNPSRPYFYTGNCNFVESGTIPTTSTANTCVDGTPLGSLRLNYGNNQYLCANYAGNNHLVLCWDQDFNYNPNDQSTYNNPYLGLALNDWKCERWGWQCGGGTYNSGYCCNGVNQASPCPTLPTLISSPKITSITPNSGPVGTNIIIIGDNFGTATGSVSFIKVGATTMTSVSIREWTNERITTSIPAVLGPGNIYNIIIERSDGTQATLNNAFTVKFPITLTQPTCIDSDGGQNYYVKGTRESPEGKVNDACRATMAISPSVPDVTEGTYLLELYCEANEPRSEFYTCPNGCKDGICITDQLNQVLITSITPASGPVGTTITIRGTNFGSLNPSNSVSFMKVGATTWTSVNINKWDGTTVTYLNGVVKTIDVNGMIEVSIPPLEPGVYNLQIEATTGTVLKENAFTVTTAQPTSDYATYTIKYESSADFSQAGGVYTTQINEPSIHIISTINQGIFSREGRSDKTTDIWLSINNENNQYLDIFYKNSNGAIKLLDSYRLFASEDYYYGRFGISETRNSDFNLKIVTYKEKSSPSALEIEVWMSKAESNLDLGSIVMQFGISTDIRSLGLIASSDESDELKLRRVADRSPNGTSSNNKTYESIGAIAGDITTDYGIIIRDPKSNSANDQVVLEIPLTQPITTTKSCEILKSSSSTSNYFNLCTEYSYNKVCFNKFTGEYQGCGKSSELDYCTLYNTNAQQNIFCEAGKEGLTVTQKSAMTPPIAKPLGAINQVPANIPSSDLQSISETAGTCQGCLYNDECLTYGTRTEDKKYCSVTGTVENQGLEEDSCINDFQCESNVCINAKCVNAGVWQKFLDWIKAIL